MRFGAGVCRSLFAVMALIGALSHAGLSQGVIANKPAFMSQSYTLNPDMSGAGPHCFRIATLPVDNVSDFDHLHLVVNLNYGWGAAANASIDALFGNRNGFTYSYAARGVPSSLTSKLVAYRNADTSVDIYLMFANVYATASYTVLETTQATVYSDPADLFATMPSGTLVFDSSSSNYPPSTFSDFNGNLGVNTTNTNGHKLMVRDTSTNGVVWSMAVNNPINMQGSSLPGVGIKLSLSAEESGGNEAQKWDGLLAYTEPGSEFGNSMGLAIYTNQGAGGGVAPTEKMRITGIGNVGIGTTAPGAKLEVAGNIKLSGGGASISFPDGTVQSTAWAGSLCGGDYAESVDVTGDRKKYEPGDVLVADPDNPGQFLKSAEPYSTLVSGIYSTKPGVVGRRQTSDPKSSTMEVPMAMVGIVPTKVSTENGPIKTGDLLVTSSTMGYAMKGTDRGQMLGAVVGKALGALDSATGVIEVLVSLQ